MCNALFELARQKFLGGTSPLDWDTQTFSAVLLDLTPSTSDVGIRQITSSTNATPIVVTTAVAHGFTTGEMLALITGKHIVVCNTTTTGTSIPVEPLKYAIPNATVLAFSTNQSATLTALANAGDRAITVTSTTVNAGARALAPATGSG